ncbi:hypothetical protein IFM89_023428, partial [Coptis chinensis]
VRWHPYFLNPSAPKEGVVKKVHYREKFGPQSERIKARMAKVFRGHGLDYDVDGLTGNTLDNHRLITFAGHQGYDKQNALVEELHLGYFTQGKYIGDKCSFCDHSPTMGVSCLFELEKYSDHIVRSILCDDSSDRSMEKTSSVAANPLRSLQELFRQLTKSM